MSSNPQIPYGRQSISEKDIEAVVQVLRSDWLTQGPSIERFEKAVAAYCQAPRAVAVTNATAALHLACLAADLGPGKRLWTSPNSFVASSNCGLYCNADVDFVDIDPRTYNMDMGALARKLEKAERDGKLPQVVIPVHFAGQSCDMKALSALKSRYGFTVIEDASHAIGGTYLGSKVGSCEYSDMTVFSFHPVKLITTGEGGMILTRDPALADRLARLRSHGITREPSLMSKPSEGPWYYEQLDLGLNYRITDLQAVLGLSQLERLDGFVRRRHELVARYDSKLASLPLTLPWQSPDTYSAFHLYVVRVDPARAQRSRREVFDRLRSAGIGVNVHYIPIHLQPYYRGLGFQPGDFPEAERYYAEAITLPLYPALTDADQDRVIAALEKALEA